MARTPKTTRVAAKRAPEPAPKKRLGRPIGSKNRVPAASKSKAATAAAPKRTAVRRAAPAAPKMNKAELEAQVAKLERTVARLRKQNAELKSSAQDEPAEPAKPASKNGAAPKAAAATPKRAPVRGRGRAKPAVEQDNTADEDAEPV